MRPYSKKYVNQISPYGCFPTAIINSYIHTNLMPPEQEYLLHISQCESNCGTPDKVRLLRCLRGVKFRRATVGDVLKHAGIITFGGYNNSDHSAFFFRKGKRIYAVNANIDTDELVETITASQLLKEYGHKISQNNNWVILN